MEVRDERWGLERMVYERPGVNMVDESWVEGGAVGRNSGWATDMALWGVLTSTLRRTTRPSSAGGGTGTGSSEWATNLSGAEVRAQRAPPASRICHPFASLIVVLAFLCRSRDSFSYSRC